MNGFLLKNGAGVLGLAVISESRRVLKITYLSDEQNLSVIFTNGDRETLPTIIDATFEPSFFSTKKIFVGHFQPDGLDKEPSQEYFVPLEL
jgi:hypothetical protein